MNADEAVAELIDRCVADFATMLASYEMRVTIPLRRGETYTTDIANRLAADGAYSQALALYERSLTLHPNDDGAQFNAGVMHEAMGQLDAALRRYDRAFGMEARSEYGLARDRVRLRMQREY
jgi:tetratricopeptide (TPR) repeat protein